MQEKMPGAILIAVVLILTIALAGVLGSCANSGEEYYHVPGVSVEVDKGKSKHYKPSAPKPAPRFGGGVGRKR